MRASPMDARRALPASTIRDRRGRIGDPNGYVDPFTGEYQSYGQ
jgi:hypothetical protein